MPVRLAPLDGPALLLGDGGASLNEADHSIAAARLARRLGSDGVAISVWGTADDDVVVSRGGTVGIRRRRLATVAAASLDAPRLRDYLAAVDGAAVYGIAVADVPAIAGVSAAARDAGSADRTWVRAADAEVLAAARAADPALRTVSTLRSAQVRGGLERHVAALRDAGIDALEMPASEWTSGQVSLCHRFRRRAWATDALHGPVVAELLLMGVDAVIGRNVELLVDIGGGGPAAPA